MMRKQLLCALIAAAALGGPAHADDTTWHFSYRGFDNATTGQYENMLLAGSFSGADRNHDGIIAIDELSSFSLDGTSYFQEEGHGCYDDGNCLVRTFSYALTGTLNLNAYHVYDDWPTIYSRTYMIGDYFEIGGQYLGADGELAYWNDRYEWNDQTVWTISPAPVPEPAVAWLLPAGLAMLMAARRRGKSCQVTRCN